MTHLAKRAKIINKNQNNKLSGSKDIHNPQIEWNRKIEDNIRPKNEIHMIRETHVSMSNSRVSLPNITFSNDDPIPDHCTGDDPLIITEDVVTTQIHRIYVDGGSSKEVMYEHFFKQLTMDTKRKMQPPISPLIGFVGQVSWPLGVITLPVTLC